MDWCTSCLTLYFYSSYISHFQHLKISISKYSGHQVIKLHQYSETKMSKWTDMGILQYARLLSSNETCWCPQRIAVIVGVSSTQLPSYPLKIHLPHKNYIVTMNSELWIICRIILLKLSCHHYVCSSIPHHSQKSLPLKMADNTRTWWAAWLTGT